MHEFAPPQPNGIEEEKGKLVLIANMLLDTCLFTHLNAAKAEERTFNYEVQLPTGQEFCIDWSQNLYSEIPPSDFRAEEWQLKEVKMWRDKGGIPVMVGGKETGELVNPTDFEVLLGQLGVKMKDLVAFYYPLALSVGRKGYVAREWGSSFGE